MALLKYILPGPREPRARAWARARARVAGAALALAIAGCGSPTPTEPPLRIAFDLWPGYYPAHVAHRAGIFDSLGVEVVIKVPENTNAMLADFAARRTELIAASIADMVPVLQRVPDLKVVLCSDESAGADAVVGSRGLKSPADLRGRRIGVKRGGFAELFVRRMLDSARVPLAAVTLVDMDASDVPAALAAGRIDAGETWEPYLTALRAAGYPVLYSSAAEPGLIVECVFAHGEVVRRRPEAMQRFVDGWFLAQERMLTDTAAALAVVAADIGRPAAELSLIGVHLLDRAENRRYLATTPSGRTLGGTIAAYEAFFGSLGQLRTLTNSAALLEPRFLR